MAPLAALPPVLTTDRLVLRGFELADVEAYVAYYTGARTGGVGGPKPRHIVVERFLAMAGQWALRGYGRYVISLASAGIGHAGILHIDDRDPPEMTWTLWDKSHEGYGYATEASRAILQAWRGPRLVARVAPDNAASVAMAHRLGFVEDPAATPPAYDPNMVTFRAPDPLQPVKDDNLV